MPLFSYACESCGHVAEFLETSSEANGNHTCPECGGKKMTRQMAAIAVGKSDGGGEMPACGSGACATGACPFA
jgi:putative FmdB family regulatory protein